MRCVWDCMFQFLWLLTKDNFKLCLWRKKKTWNGPVPVLQVTVLTISVTLQKHTRIIHIQQNVNLRFRKKNRGIYTFRWSIFAFWIWVLHQPEKWNTFSKKTSNTQQRERKRSLFIMFLQSPLSDVLWLQLFFNWQASGMLRELVTRWWISFSTLAGWSNKPKADIDICHSTLEPYRLLCWLVKYFTSL